MNYKHYVVIGLAASLWANYSIADSGVNSVSDNIVHPSGNPLPAPGYARPPFHITRNASTGPVGLTPAKVTHFYGINQITNHGAGQTIAIVDAYDDPNIASDLAVFSSTLAWRHAPRQTAVSRKSMLQAANLKPTQVGRWKFPLTLSGHMPLRLKPKLF